MADQPMVAAPLFSLRDVRYSSPIPPFERRSYVWNAL